AVDGGQKLARIVPLALLLPEAAEAHGGAQLQRRRLLAVSDVEGLTKTGLRLWLVANRAPPEQVSPEAIQLRPPQAASTLAHRRQGLGQHTQPLFSQSHFPIRLRQQGKKICPSGARGL